MQLSAQPTDYLLVRAYTQSYWDICSFAIIRIDAKWRKAMQERLHIINAEAETTDFYAMQYFDCMEGFFVGESIEAILTDSKDYAFVNMMTEELDTFEVPETALDMQSFFITKYGTAYYSAHGKYTGEEFRTTEFNIGAILASFC